MPTIHFLGCIFTPQTEALSTVIMGAWIAIALLIPAVFGIVLGIGKSDDRKVGGLAS